MLTSTVSRIFEQLALAYPYGEAKTDLALMMNAQLSMSAPQVIRLCLRVAGARLSKDAVLTCGRPATTAQPWKIAWRPQSGRFPDFTGDLSVREDPGDGSAVLVLTGEYTPPFKKFGKAFDRLLGRYIAIALCRQLLVVIAQGLRVGTMRTWTSIKRSEISHS